MIYVVATVYDSKVKAYLPPWFSVNQAVAQRAFSDVANLRDHMIYKNPQDFGLFIIGTFNDDTAEIRMLPQPINLGLAASYVRELSNVQYEDTSKPVSDEARVLTGAPGGNSKKHVRSESRPQDDV